MNLPTAEELLPLLADALGTGVEGPTVEQLRSASDLIAEHAEWRSNRADVSAGESAGDFPTSLDWQASDDAGCDLADRAGALFAELTGQQGPTSTSTSLPWCSQPSRCRLLAWMPRRGYAAAPSLRPWGTAGHPRARSAEPDPHTGEENNEMNETNQTPTHSTARADVAWRRITQHSESGSAIEDRLAALVDAEPAASRFRVDVIHPDPV